MGRSREDKQKGRGAKEERKAGEVTEMRVEEWRTGERERNNERRRGEREE